MTSYFNKNLKYLFNTRSLTAESVAYNTGLDATVLQNYIDGSLIPDIHSVFLMADFLNLPIDLLLLQDIELKENIKNSFDFKFLVLDVDGVMTDGGIIYTEAGDEIKKFNAKDGLAIIRLTGAGLRVGFLSSGFSKNMIEKRAQVLGVHYVYVGTWNKLEILEKWCNELNIGMENVAYIGDDSNDLAIIEKVGLSACPSDATDLIKKNVNIILNAGGGKSCVREFVDNYLNAHTKNTF
jgi:3-deoxy-D-manno-octulosonate 8-phosphate phosphatase (KDO 8-P phosphatase)